MGDTNIREYINLANAVTSLRMAGAIIMIFLTPLSVPFYIVYTVCGLSDGIDGTIARKMGTSSDFGARLDSVCDLAFYTVMFLKILPVLWEIMPGWIWILVLAIIVVRVVSYGYVAVKYHRLAAIHTYLNKVTGALVFVIPYFFLLPWEVALCAATCIIALAGSIEELIIHLSTKAYQTERKSIFSKVVE